MAFTPPLGATTTKTSAGTLYEVKTSRTFEKPIVVTKLYDSRRVERTGYETTTQEFVTESWFVNNQGVVERHQQFSISERPQYGGANHSVEWVMPYAQPVIDETFSPSGQPVGSVQTKIIGYGPRGTPRESVTSVNFLSGTTSTQRDTDNPTAGMVYDKSTEKEQWNSEKGRFDKVRGSGMYKEVPRLGYVTVGKNVIDLGMSNAPAGTYRSGGDSVMITNQGQVYSVNRISPFAQEQFAKQSAKQEYLQSVNQLQSQGVLDESSAAAARTVAVPKLLNIAVQKHNEEVTLSRKKQAFERLYIDAGKKARGETSIDYEGGISLVTGEVVYFNSSKELRTKLYTEMEGQDVSIPFLPGIGYYKKGLSATETLAGKGVEQVRTKVPYGTSLFSSDAFSRFFAGKPSSATELTDIGALGIKENNQAGLNAFWPKITNEQFRGALAQARNITYNASEGLWNFGSNMVKDVGAGLYQLNKRGQNWDRIIMGLPEQFIVAPYKLYTSKTTQPETSGQIENYFNRREELFTKAKAPPSNQEINAGIFVATTGLTVGAGVVGGIFGKAVATGIGATFTTMQVKTTLKNPTLTNTLLSAAMISGTVYEANPFSIQKFGGFPKSQEAFAADFAAKQKRLPSTSKTPELPEIEYYFHGTKNPEGVMTTGIKPLNVLNELDLSDTSLLGSKDSFVYLTKNKKVAESFARQSETGEVLRVGLTKEQVSKLQAEPFTEAAEQSFMYPETIPAKQLSRDLTIPESIKLPKTDRVSDIVPTPISKRTPKFRVLSIEGNGRSFILGSVSDEFKISLFKSPKINFGDVDFGGGKLRIGLSTATEKKIVSSNLKSFEQKGIDVADLKKWYSEADELVRTLRKTKSKNYELEFKPVVKDLTEQDVVTFGKEISNEGGLVYGSAAQQLGLRRGLKVVAGDIDVITPGSDAVISAERFVKVLNEQRNTDGFLINSNPENKAGATIINAKTEHQVGDIHAARGSNIFGDENIEMSFGYKESRKSRLVGNVNVRLLEKELVSKANASFGLTEYEGKIGFYPKTHRVRDPGGFLRIAQGLAEDAKSARSLELVENLRVRYPEQMLEGDTLPFQLPEKGIKNGEIVYGAISLAQSSSASTGALFGLSPNLYSGINKKSFGNILSNTVAIPQVKNGSPMLSSPKFKISTNVRSKMTQVSGMPSPKKSMMPSATVSSALISSPKVSHSPSPGGSRSPTLSPIPSPSPSMSPRIYPSPSPKSPSPSLYPKIPSTQIYPKISISPNNATRGILGFDVFVKRYGKLKKVASNLPRGMALKFGSETTVRNLGATFMLEPAGTTTQEDINYTPNRKVFRDYVIKKGQRIKLENAFIQKRGTRLGSPEERSEILSAKNSAAMTRNILGV